MEPLKASENGPIVRAAPIVGRINACAIFYPAPNRNRQLELSFESKALRTICENQSEATLELGNSVARALQHRLADLEAATSLKNLIVGNPRVMDGSEGKVVLLDLCDGRTLMFSANHVKNPITKDNQLDWDRVTRIKIIGIADDHG